LVHFLGGFWFRGFGVTVGFSFYFLVGFCWSRVGGFLAQFLGFSFFF